jgi:hypothetical protein
MIPSFSIIGLRNLKIWWQNKDYAIAHENIAEINTMVTQLENTCNLAFTELETI